MFVVDLRVVYFCVDNFNCPPCFSFMSLGTHVVPILISLLCIVIERHQGQKNKTNGKSEKVSKVTVNKLKRKLLPGPAI